MPKQTARASAIALPKETIAKPDAALIALVDKTLEAERHLHEMLEKRDAAEERSKPIATPDVVIKTEEDAKWKLFLGHGVGSPYHEDEVAALRIWHRAEGKKLVAEGSLVARERAGKILEAWVDWQDARCREEERVGLDKAEAVYREAARVHSDLLCAVLKTKAAALDGVMAKLKAAVAWLPLENGFEEQIRDGLRLYGADEDVIAFSIVRDMLAIAGLGGALMLDSLSEARPDGRLPELPLVEPALNLPVYVTGLAKAQVRDGALHLAFHIDLDGPCGVERVLNLRVAMQAHAWREAALKIEEALAAFRRSFDA